MSEKIQKFILLMVGVLSMSLAIGYLVFAWVEPGANPPQGNVPAPINVGDVVQTKTGRLGIGSLDTNYYLTIGTTTAGINAGLKITNPGSQPSLYVEDEPGDPTPFVIDAAGNVGIGTSTPAVKLHVDAGAIAIRQSGTYGDVWGQWQRSAINTESFNTISGFYGTRYNWDSDWMFIGVKNEGANRKDAVILWADDAAESLRFLHARAGESSVREYMRITGDGNVGIGTTTPAYKLDVVGGDIRTTGRYRRGNDEGVDSATCPAGQTFSGLTVSGGIITFAGSCTSIGGAGGYTTIQDEGTSLPQRSTLNFTGAGVTCSDDGTKTNCNIPGGGISWPLLAPDGSAGAPSYSFANNSNMGMFRAGANILAFSTAGTERLRIDGNGNVGIGTTTPAYKLDVNGNIRGNFVASDGTSCGGSQILKRNQNGDAWTCTARMSHMWDSYNVAWDPFTYAPGDGSTWADVPNSTRTINLPVASNLLVFYTGTVVRVCSSATWIEMRIVLDGSQIGSIITHGIATALPIEAAIFEYAQIAIVAGASSVSAGSHTIKLQWRSGPSSPNCWYSDGGTMVSFAL
jgi:hypothetical protein